MLPKRRFWKAGQTFQTVFSKHFSRVWVPDLGYKTSKSASKTQSERFVRPSKIFVWEVYIYLQNQPSATHPRFWQTCLFTIFPNISTTISGSQFWENREKAGLSKTGVSCRRMYKIRHGYFAEMLFPTWLAKSLHNPAWVSHRRLDGDSLATHWRVGVVTRKLRSLPFCICRLDTQTWGL